MADDLQMKKEKDLLWDYTKTVSALEAFRANFRSLADSFEVTATVLREHPEELADFDFRGTQEKFDAAMVSAKEYKEMLYRNAEQKVSLVKMGILS